jgi:hypothetical protein
VNNSSRFGAALDGFPLGLAGTFLAFPRLKSRSSTIAHLLCFIQIVQSSAWNPGRNSGESACLLGFLRMAGSMLQTIAASPPDCGADGPN